MIYLYTIIITQKENDMKTLKIIETKENTIIVRIYNQFSAGRGANQEISKEYFNKIKNKFTVVK